MIDFHTGRQPLLEAAAPALRARRGRGPALDQERRRAQATERATALRERAAAAAARRLGSRAAGGQRALDETTRRRDEQACEVRRLRHELDKAKGRHDRYAELKEAHAALQEDYSSLQASLEASERIRAKQRDLLRSLQGDESVADDDASPLEDDRYERLMTGEESFIGDDADESPSPPPPPRRAVKKVARRKRVARAGRSPARRLRNTARRLARGAQGGDAEGRGEALHAAAARRRRRGRVAAALPPPPSAGALAATASAPARRKAAAKPAPHCRGDESPRKRRQKQR